jgi:MFS family permease
MGNKVATLSFDDRPANAGLSLWFIFAVCFLETVAGGSAATLLSTYLPSITRDLPGIRPERLSGVSALINAVFLAGWTIGGFTWGLVCDKIGRTRSLSLAVGMVGAFTVLATLFPHWETLFLFRFLSGFGVGGTLVIATIFLSEIWPEKSRAIFIGLLSIGFPVGIFSTGAIVYLIADWKQGFLTGILPLILSLVTWFMFSESERWKQAGLEPGNRQMVWQIMEHRKDIVTGSVIFGAMLIGLWALFMWIPTWVQSLVTDGTGREKGGMSMMLLGIGGLSGGAVSGWIFRSLGPRKAMTICFMACFVLSLILFGLNDHLTWLMLAEIALLAFVFGISQGMLSVYIPLLFPPSIRGTATGVCFNTGRVLTTAAVFFVGALVGFFGGYGNSLLAFSFVFLIGLFFIFLTPAKRI